MSLVPFRKSHTHAFGAGFEDFDRLFDGMFRNALTNISTQAPSVTDLSVRMDISETKDAYVVKADLPGVEEKDVEVTLDDGVLTVSGEKQSEKEEDGKTFHRVERSYGSFHRSMSLPTDADENAISARAKHGVLEVKIGKKKETPKTARRINVRAL